MLQGQQVLCILIGSLVDITQTEEERVCRGTRYQQCKQKPPVLANYIVILPSLLGTLFMQLPYKGSNHVSNNPDILTAFIR